MVEGPELKGETNGKENIGWGGEEEKKGERSGGKMPGMAGI